MTYFKPSLGRKIAIADRQICNGVVHCAYCLQSVFFGRRGYAPNSATIEHILPRSVNADHSDFNLIIACMSCNLKRSNTPLITWLAEIADQTGQIADDILARINSIILRPIDTQLQRTVNFNVKRYNRPTALRLWRESRKIISGHIAA